jgi:uncharacterized cupin superfamily protein
VSGRVGVHEAKVGRTEAGAVVESDGWFVLNLADVAWMRSEIAGEWTMLEPENPEFTHYGIGVHVVQPGQPNGLYHAENVQEGFLVLSGECLLIVEEQERRLKAWDFFHCAPGTHHIIVGAGEGPCAILMVGARSPDKKLHYPVSEMAARHGASAPEDTNTPRVAYREWPRDFTPVAATWPLA